MNTVWGVPALLRPSPELSRRFGGRSKYVLRPDVSARMYLSALAPLYRLSDEQLASAELRSVEDLGRGAIIATFRQRVGGLEVLNANLAVAMDQDLNLLSVSGSFSPHAGSSHGRFLLDSERAVLLAVQKAGGTAARISTARPSTDEDGYELLDVEGTPARVKRVLYALPDRLEPAYHVELKRNGSGDTWTYVIGAQDGVSLSDPAGADPHVSRGWADATSGCPYAQTRTSPPAAAWMPPDEAGPVTVLASFGATDQAAGERPLTPIRQEPGVEHAFGVVDSLQGWFHVAGHARVGPHPTSQKK